MLGRLDTARPEVAVRAGAYGAWLPVPWGDVFASGRGAFRDTQFDPPGAEGAPCDPAGGQGQGPDR